MAFRSPCKQLGENLYLSTQRNWAHANRSNNSLIKNFLSVTFFLSFYSLSLSLFLTEPNSIALARVVSTRLSSLSWYVKEINWLVGWFIDWLVN